jgi:hypothetical protein
MWNDVFPQQSSHHPQPWGLQARPACLSGFVVVDFPDRGYPGMFSASSPLLPESDSGSVTCGEVLGELVDVSCLNTQEYAQLLQEVASI